MRPPGPQLILAHRSAPKADLPIRKFNQRQPVSQVLILLLLWLMRWDTGLTSVYEFAAKSAWIYIFRYSKHDRLDEQAGNGSSRTGRQTTDWTAEVAGWREGKHCARGISQR